MDKICVIARYEENIDWVDKLNCEYIIYNKGSHLENREYIKIENKGRDLDTYFHYIIENFEKLPSYVIFLQGDPIGPPNRIHCSDVINQINDFKFDVEIKMLGNVESNGETQIHLQEFLPFIFENPPQVTVGGDLKFCGGAQYIVKSSLLRQKSLTWWKKLHYIYTNPWEYGYDFFEKNEDIYLPPGHSPSHLKNLGFSTYKDWISYNIPHIFERIMLEIFLYKE
jgi:hypothetical protein